MNILRDPSGERLFLEGRLEGLGVPDLIHAICLPRRTGILTLSRAEISKTIYIKNGQLVFAASNVAEDRLGETLLRDGVIGYGQLETAIGYMGGGKRLGSILVELGYLAPDKLVRGLLHQVKEIILGLFPWEGGAYRFVEEPLPTAEVITLNIATSKLILDGIRRITSWPRIVRSVGYARATYRLTREGRAIAEELDLGEAEKLILASLERPVSVGEICRSVFLANFDVYQFLWAFRILGIIQQVESDPDAAEVSESKGETHGQLLETPISTLLLGFCRRGETGVLYLTHDGDEKSIHIKNGVVVFATSNRADEALTTFLLRRGVIGLRDKDEIERRLLSNRRPGKILREMGILMQDELVRFVREQLREIVLSVFAWERGEWRFLAGELPSVEEIVLDRPIEELVLQGIRSVRDWSRIRAGCGDLTTVLRKASSPPFPASALEMGPDESEVLAAVDEPSTVAEICEVAAITDHRAGQILWGLQILGVLERAPVVANEIAANEIVANEVVANEVVASDVVANETVAKEIVAEEAVTPQDPVEAPVLEPVATSVAEPSLSSSKESLAPEEAPARERRLRSWEMPAAESDAGRGHASSHDASSSDFSVKALSPSDSPDVRESAPEPVEDEASASSAPARTPLEAVGSGVLEEIERFNRRHRELYAVLKGAVGAGAKNFVATCIRRLGTAASDFSGLAPDETGAFSPESLYERVGSFDPARIRGRLESLIDMESETASVFLDPKTLERLRKRLETATWDLAGKS